MTPKLTMMHSRICFADLQKVYAEMQGRGLDAQSIRHVHAVLNSALKQAVKWGMQQRNPAELVELPKVEQKEWRVLSTTRRLGVSKRPKRQKAAG